MKNLLMLMMLTTMALPCQAAVESVVLTSSAFLAKERPTPSPKLPGFVRFMNDEVEWDVAATRIVSIHRFNDGGGHTNLVVDVPLVMGRINTFIMIPHAVMTYDQVVELVRTLRAAEH